MTKRTFKLITDGSKLSAEIVSIRNTGAKFERRVYVAAVSCLAHIEAHGDITLLNDLVKALPGMARRNAIFAWAPAFGKVAYDGDTKAFVYDKRGKTDIEGAMNVSPWEFKPEAEFKPFDLSATLAKLVEKAEKRSEKADARDSIDAATLAMLKVVAFGPDAMADVDGDTLNTFATAITAAIEARKPSLAMAS